MTKRNEKYITEAIMIQRKTSTLSGFSHFLLLITMLLPSAGHALEYTKLDTIRDTVRQFIVTNLGGENPDTKVIVKALDPRLRLASCEHDLEVYLAPGTKLRGHSTVGVRCSTPNPWALFVPVHIELLVPVLTASKPLRRGQRLGAENLLVKKKSSTSLPSNYLRAGDVIIGQVAARDIGIGSVLTQSMFKPEKLVKRGQRVMLSMKSGAIAVRVSGIAMADGARGERIKVKNLSSERIVDGTVSDANLILVGSSSIR